MLLQQKKYAAANVLDDKGYYVKETGKMSFTWPELHSIFHIRCNMKDTRPNAHTINCLINFDEWKPIFRFERIFS